MVKRGSYPHNRTNNYYHISWTIASKKITYVGGVPQNEKCKNKSNTKEPPKKSPKVPKLPLYGYTT